MLRRLHPEQPESFAFTPDNQKWAEAQIQKYPDGRAASAIIPLLWRAQEQEGWLSRPAIEHVAEMLGMAYIRALEVATFYFMFQLQPVGSVAHFQICGTTSCMIMGAEDLVSVCKKKIAAKAHQVSEDGKFSWEEVECLGACTNAPMAQIGKDYYEDLTPEGLEKMIDDMAKGEVPLPGPANGRYTSEPKGGLTALTEGDREHEYNGSVQLAHDIGDTLKRIDGTEVPFSAPWLDKAADHGSRQAGGPQTQREAAAEAPATKPVADDSAAKPETDTTKPVATENKDEPVATEADKPATLDAARDGQADDLKLIKGVGPKLEEMLNGMGFYHFDQIAAWTDKELAWVDQNLEGFKGRASRDEWVSQAKQLASGEETEFASRAKKDGIYDN
ncbi:MAG: NADH-quinone oxidoreductase subunit E [Donghicola eburneus]|nr:NADH-quinone oxidoreductase subunit E [Donghicola eburneus]MCI5042180.1 NADH-quinone oxidoreductase subunit E [Donghicola eburneus]